MTNNLAEGLRLHQPQNYTNPKLQLWAAQNPVKGNKWPWGRTLDTPALDEYNFIKVSIFSFFSTF